MKAYLVGGQLEKQENKTKMEKGVYIKYKDRHISCKYILDNIIQGYNTVQKNAKDTYIKH